MMLAILGVDLIYRGATGRSWLYRALGVNSLSQAQNGATVPYRQGIRVDEAVTIGKPVEEVYQFWRRFDNLPYLMQHLQSVTVVDENTRIRSRRPLEAGTNHITSSDHVGRRRAAPFRLRTTFRIPSIETDLSGIAPVPGRVQGSFEFIGNWQPFFVFRKGKEWEVYSAKAAQQFALCRCGSSGDRASSPRRPC